MIEGTTGLRKILSNGSPPIDKVLATGVLPRLITFLDDSAPSLLQFESCWCISNIASGTPEHTKQVFEHGVMGPLVRFLSPTSGANEDLKEQCVWAIGNLTGDEPTYRDEALYLGVVDYIVNLAQTTKSVPVLKILSWTLSNLCRGKPPPPFHLVAPSLTVLETLVSHTDDEIATDSVWAISHLSSNTSPEVIQCIVDCPGLLKHMVSMMNHPVQGMMVPALRVVGNICSSIDAANTKLIIELGVLPIIKTLFSHPKKGVRKEAFWMASNIAVGSTAQIQQMIELSFYGPIVQRLGMEHEGVDVKREIAWTLSNTTHEATPEQLDYIVTQYNTIPTILDTLYEHPEDKLTPVLLEALNNILECGQLKKPNPYITQCETNNINDILDFLLDESCGVPSPEIESLVINIQNFFEFKEYDDSVNYKCEDEENQDKKDKIEILDLKNISINDDDGNHL